MKHLRMIAASMAGLLAISLSATPALPKDKGPLVSSLTPMRESSVRALLSDVEIGPECCDAAEEFYRDGYYVRLGYSGMPGVYTVKGNLVCSTRTEDRVTRCRYFYTGAAGAAYMALAGEKRAELVAPRPIAKGRLARHAARSRSAQGH